MKKYIKIITVIFLLAFGGLTVFLTSSVLLDLFGIRQKEGNFVPFIVWINLVSGIAFIVSAIGIFKNTKWSFPFLLINVVLLLAGIVALYFHIQAGGLYKMETVKGMVFRVIVTSLATYAAYYLINRQSYKNKK